MKPVWATRTGATSDAFLAYSETITEDLPFLVHDLCGSVAHVLGLEKAGLLDDEETTALVAGLRALAAEHEAGTLSLDPKLEDIHMNLEAQLTEMLGDTGKKLHTGRSRNDQVATCITLHAREGIAGLAQATHRIAAALTAQAKTHQATPWVAQTHGQPAQPATLGFLLAAHAFRFEAMTRQVLQAFEAMDISPLGSGAVAGSTLPLDPAYTASLLGLRPPNNALLAAGGRDTSLQAVQLCGQAGALTASLAQDLLDLFSAGHLSLPDGFTTGSSLMPQKRNPDALELVRGKGKLLTGMPAQAMQLVTGLGLGYMRDLQAIKPVQHAALAEARATLDILATSIEQGAFSIPDSVLEAPGITATDAAEALVARGIPFRSAYQALAAAHKAVEGGQQLQAALMAQDLPLEALEAAVAALQPDPARRATLGGPAPVQVAAQAATLQGLLQGQQDALDAAQDAVAVPYRLLAGGF